MTGVFAKGGRAARFGEAGCLGRRRGSIAIQVVHEYVSLTPEPANGAGGSQRPSARDRDERLPDQPHPL